MEERMCRTCKHYQPYTGAQAGRCKWLEGIIRITMRHRGGLVLQVQETGRCRDYAENRQEGIDHAA